MANSWSTSPAIGCSCGRWRISSRGKSPEPTWAAPSPRLSFHRTVRRSPSMPQADNTIKRIDLAGGAAVTICQATNPFGMHWSEDGLVFGQGRARNHPGVVAGRRDRDRRAGGSQRSVVLASPASGRESGHLHRGGDRRQLGSRPDRRSGDRRRSNDADRRWRRRQAAANRAAGIRARWRAAGRSVRCRETSRQRRSDSRR